MKHLLPEHFLPLNAFTETVPIRIDLAYAQDRLPNIFGPVYHKHARLWIYEPLGRAVLEAAKYIFDTDRLYMIAYDSLRTTDAQAAMMETEIVKAHPQWLEEPNRLLSPPGAGAHPRGMAVDVTLAREDGSLLDMGTVFDHLAEISDADHNPAHRFYRHLTDEHRQNRELLNKAMLHGAAKTGIPLHLLESEWWDFRLPADYYSQYAPLSDADLPLYMRMVEDVGPQDLPPAYSR
jgi:D-alanyl-D-alanine dipeptidase